MVDVVASAAGSDGNLGVIGARARPKWLAVAVLYIHTYMEYPSLKPHTVDKKCVYNPLPTG
jgi:hypothetical protein